jgi:hypothetical protein
VSELEAADSADKQGDWAWDCGRPEAINDEGWWGRRGVGNATALMDVVL